MPRGPEKEAEAEGDTHQARPIAPGSSSPGPPLQTDLPRPPRGVHQGDRGPSWEGTGRQGE